MSSSGEVTRLQFVCAVSMCYKVFDGVNANEWKLVVQVIKWSVMGAYF